MIDHFGINCSDFEASARFYDEVLGVLGYSRQMDVGVAIGYGTEGHPDFWISRWSGTEPNREMHCAFQADGVEAVRAFHAKALGSSGRSRCTSRGCGRSTTPATTAPSSATPTATTSRPSSTAPDPTRDAPRLTRCVSPTLRVTRDAPTPAPGPAPGPALSR